jgi:hypothetical protein
MNVDRSPEAVTRRLKQVDELRRGCLALAGPRLKWDWRRFAKKDSGQGALQPHHPKTRLQAFHPVTRPCHVTEPASSRQARQEQRQHLLVDPFSLRRMFSDGHVGQHPFSKPDSLQKLRHHRTGPTPRRQLFVRERNLNLSHPIRPRTLSFVLHFFVLLSFLSTRAQ